MAHLQSESAPNKASQLLSCLFAQPVKVTNMLLLFFSILACNTSNTKWLIYSLSQHLTRLANDFPVFFAEPVKVTNMLLLFFSILACNTSNTKWLIYSLSQHLTRLANDFPVFF